MKYKFRAVAFAAALSAAPLFGQTVAYDAAAITAACSTGEVACVAAVQAAVDQIAASGQSVTDRNSQLAALAGLLVDLAGPAPVATLPVFADAISLIALVSTDTSQISALQSVVSSLRSGAVPTTVPFGAAPNGLSDN